MGRSSNRVQGRDETDVPESRHRFRRSFGSWVRCTVTSMNRIVLALLSAAVLAGVLTGCSASPLAETPSPSPSPTEAAVSGPLPVESLAAIADTRWTGVDSDGDRVTFKFNEDGTASFSSYGQKYSYPEDLWSVRDNTITWNATFGNQFGVVTYVGTLDADTQVIGATSTSTTGRTGTIELEQPVR